MLSGKSASRSSQSSEFSARLSPSVIQQFLLLLYRELGGVSINPVRPFEWMQSLNLAALGDLKAQAELAAVRAEKA